MIRAVRGLSLYAGYGCHVRRKWRSTRRVGSGAVVIRVRANPNMGLSLQILKKALGFFER